MSKNLLFAAACASLTAIIGVSVGFYALARLSGLQVPASNVEHAAFFFAFFGWPIALALSVAVGFSAVVLHRGGSYRLTLWTSVLGSGLLGAVVLSICWAILWNGFEGTPSSAAVGFLAGSLAGICFWALIRKSLAPPS
jgi:hypothetical protein